MAKALATRRSAAKAATPASGDGPGFSLGGLMSRSGEVSVERVAQTFSMTKTQIAETVGLRAEAVFKLARASAPRTQQRIREMLEIIARVSVWAGGEQQAMAWYRSQPIPAFGGQTAEGLIKAGYATALRDYLDHISTGGFA